MKRFFIIMLALIPFTFTSCAGNNNSVNSVSSNSTSSINDNQTSSQSSQTSSGRSILYTNLDSKDFEYLVPFGTNIIEFKKIMKTKNITFIKPEGAEKFNGIREDGGLIGSDPTITFCTNGINYAFSFKGNAVYNDENFLLSDIAITDKQYKTKKGLSIGDSITKMKTLYGNNYTQYGDEYDYNGNSIRLTCTSKNGIITRINVFADYSESNG